MTPVIVDQRAHDLAVLQKYRMADGEFHIDLNDSEAMAAFSRLFTVVYGEWHWPRQFKPVLYVSERTP